MFIMRFHGHHGNNLIFEDQAHLPCRYGQFWYQAVIITMSQTDTTAFFVHGQARYDGDVQAIEGDSLAPLGIGLLIVILIIYSSIFAYR